MDSVVLDFWDKLNCIANKVQITQACMLSDVVVDMDVARLAFILALDEHRLDSEQVLDAWDRMNNLISRLQVAHVEKLGQVLRDLERARLHLEHVIRQHAISTAGTQEKMA